MALIVLESFFFQMELKHAVAAGIWRRKVHVILPSDTARSDLRNLAIAWFSVHGARFYP
jgi:hypothetical protein